MPRKSSKKLSYKQKLKELRKRYDPEKYRYNLPYDLRRKLTPGQKSAIARAYNRFIGGRDIRRGGEFIRHIPPKPPRKKPDYSSRIQILSGKATLKYDPRTLSAGQKSAVTKAFKQIRQYKSKNFVKINRQKGESEAAYHKRLNRIRRAYGQDTPHGDLLSGVFVDIPTGVKYRVIGDKIVFYSKAYREVSIAADQELLATDPSAETERVWNDYDFDVIFINYAGHGRSMGFEKTNARFSDFEDELSQMSFSYKDTLAFAVSGYILRHFN